MLNKIIDICEIDFVLLKCTKGYHYDRFHLVVLVRLELENFILKVNLKNFRLLLSRSVAPK